MAPVGQSDHDVVESKPLSILEEIVWLTITPRTNEKRHPRPLRPHGTSKHLQQLLHAPHKCRPRENNVHSLQSPWFFSLANTP